MGSSRYLIQDRVIGLTEGNVLTNVPAAWLTYYLPQLQVGNLGNDTATLLTLLRQEKVDAVIVLHNERGAWPDVDSYVLKAIRSQFSRYVSGGPSAFSWYELFYGPVDGTQSIQAQCPLTSSRAVWHAVSRGWVEQCASVRGVGNPSILQGSAGGRGEPTYCLANLSH